jgi:peroxiredoxin
MKNIWYYLFLICTAACNAERVKVSGHIDNADGTLITCGKVRSNKYKTSDSMRLNRDGSFSFSILLENGKEDFIQLKLDSLQPVVLLVNPGEKISVKADAADFYTSLNVDGCKECSDMLLMQKTLWTANARMDSLYKNITDEREFQRQASKIFVEQKRFNTAFIMRHLGSLASAAAYHQKLGKNLPLFGYAGDRFMLTKMVDSLRIIHPKSAYTLWLQSDLEKLNNMAAQQLLQERINAAPAVNKPDIVLPDINGKLQSLGALTGNVTLLQFWSAKQPSNQLDNRELLNLYKEFAVRNFKIYQVSLDTDSALWRNAVRQQGLIWTNVCSFNGTYCKAALLYNVSALPCNFLINKKGEIAAKNLFDKELRSKIVHLLGE